MFLVKLLSWKQGKERTRVCVLHHRRVQAIVQWQLSLCATARYRVVIVEGRNGGILPLINSRLLAKASPGNV